MHFNVANVATLGLASIEACRTHLLEVGVLAGLLHILLIIRGVRIHSDTACVPVFVTGIRTHMMHAWLLCRLMLLVMPSSSYSSLNALVGKSLLSDSAHLNLGHALQ